MSLSISPIRDQSGRIIGASKIIRDVTARKEADEALAAATAKFESVFNQSGIFAGILDTEGNVRDINALALDACGYTRDEVLGVPFWDTRVVALVRRCEGAYPPGGEPGCSRRGLP